MSDTIIRVERLSKRYIIGHQRNRRDGLRHRVEAALRNPYRWLLDLRQSRREAREDFWALKEVSFQVRQGEVMGVIGRNGAGKSTLLKILSRITEPSEGEIRIKGRVACLLEVGTGFHQDLTGRENIFLNGAILGMNRSEIRRKFDEIVAFAEVEKFLDTPVKRFSSGMYVRLAFAVAAHLEPEILVVDEVLAVGDAQFQKKCLGKMGEVTRGGRTILFVSHNMGTIRRLCQSALLLDKGILTHAGPTEEVLSRYLRNLESGAGQRIWQPDEPGTKDSRIRLRALRALNAEEEVSERIDIARPMKIEVEYELREAMPLFRVALRFDAADGTTAFYSSDSADPGFDDKPRGPGIYTSQCIVPERLLNEGSYTVTLSGDIPYQKTLFVEEAALSFTVEPTGGVNSRFMERWPGVVCPRLRWQTQPVKEKTH